MAEVSDRTYLTVGVTGHIDHGKTTLVGRLTGIETDTHPEEKKRGITIDLGFASMRDGEFTFAFVDAPGHQKYIGNLLAGVAAVDVGLLVVACDQGIQEQTLEHASILQTLGVPRLIVALSRIDLCDDAKRLEVQEELEVFLADYGFSEIPVVPVSSHSGEGLDELRAKLKEAAQFQPERPAWLADASFRMPIDRVLQVPGRGLVVAGTVWSGSVSIGDHLQVLGHASGLRVRELEVHGAAVESSSCGRRTAINLVGDVEGELRRGDELVALGTAGTKKILIELKMYPESKTVKLPTTIQLHTGTGAVAAKISGPKELKPRQEAVALVEAESEVLAVYGQSCLLRLPYPVGSFAGGRVLGVLNLDTLAAKNVKRSQWLELGSKLAEVETAVDAALAWIETLGELDLDPVWLEEQLRSGRENLSELKAQVTDHAQVQQLEAKGGMTQLVHRSLIDRVASSITKNLKAQAASHNDAWLTQDAVIERLRTKASVPAIKLAIDQLVEEKQIVALNGLLAAASETTMLSKKQRAKMVELLRLFEGNVAPPTLKEVAEKLSLATDAATSLLRHATQQRLLIALDGGLHVHANVFQEMCTSLRALFATEPQLTVPQIKDCWGVTRKHAIPLLEYCDQLGFTIRTGDTRQAGPKLLAE